MTTSFYIQIQQYISAEMEGNPKMEGNIAQ